MFAQSAPLVQSSQRFLSSCKKAMTIPPLPCVLIDYYILLWLRNLPMLPIPITNVKHRVMPLFLYVCVHTCIENVTEIFIHLNSIQHLKVVHQETVVLEDISWMPGMQGCTSSGICLKGSREKNCWKLAMPFKGRGRRPLHWILGNQQLLMWKENSSSLRKAVKQCSGNSQEWSIRMSRLSWSLYWVKASSALAEINSPVNTPCLAHHVPFSGYSSETKSNLLLHLHPTFWAIGLLSLEALGHL